MEPSPGLEAWIALASDWAGPGRLAVVVSGSHASGEAVWAPGPRGPVSLSDLDLYVVVRDRRAQRAAEARARAWRRGAAGQPPAAARLLDLGLAGALEAAFLAADSLERLPARPGTLELRRHGRVVEGDPAWLGRVPDFSPRDVSGEEILLLLENRAFELLDAHIRGAAGDPLERLAGRHATLKTALDLATVACLAAGEFPDGAAARVTMARRLRERSGGSEPPWEAALGWRAGRVEPLEPPAAEREWLGTASAWIGAWEARIGAPDPAESVPYASARRAAGRARLRRRLLHALTFRARGGPGPRLLERLRYSSRGTPQHRLNASAAVLLVRAVRAAGAADEGGTARDWARALGWLGVIRASGEPAEAEREVVRRWDHWILDGQRCAGRP